MKGISPTQRSLALLRHRGYLVAVVERWNAHLRIRQDLWGFADLLAMRGNEVSFVQVTASGVSSRLAKIAMNETAQKILTTCGSNVSIVVHGWRKVGPRGKRKLWECREVFCKPSPNTSDFSPNDQAERLT